MDQTKIRRAAEILWRARLDQRRIEALPDSVRPATLADGYAIQDAMVPLAQQPVVGWKVAATSAAGRAHIGVAEPLAGRLFQDFVLPDGATLAAAPIHMAVVETEFAFRLARDLPAAGAEYDMRQVCDAVSAMHLAIEVPDARYDDYSNPGAPQIAADDSFAAWFVLGPKVRDWRRLDLPTQKVRLLKNGMVAAEGVGSNALEDPRLALTWLANHLAKRGLYLKAGDIVTTGTCIVPAAIAPGDDVIAEFTGLGQVTLSFT